MGKRSDFARNPRDFYPTPPEAVIPLLPHLPRAFTFAEPCAGDGALVDALRVYGGRCVYAADIEPRANYIIQAEAEDVRLLGGPCDFIITNPPWTREILHNLITAFRTHRPTWLLFDADWIHTKQAEPFLPYCHKIVSVGRVKWIKDSPHTGKDNAAWYLFDREEAPTVFIGRAA